MEFPHHIKILVRAIGVVKLAGATLAAAETPPATPAPKPGTLAAYASSVTLQGWTGHGRLTITTENLAELGSDGALTVATAPDGEPGELDLRIEVDPKVREHWRKKVLAQGQATAGLEARRREVLDEIDRLERGRLDSRTLDRIAKAESKLAQVEEQIRQEKARLSRLVREARKEGAQPGWFR